MALTMPCQAELMLHVSCEDVGNKVDACCLTLNVTLCVQDGALRSLFLSLCSTGPQTATASRTLQTCLQMQASYSSRGPKPGALRQTQRLKAAACSSTCALAPSLCAALSKSAELQCSYIVLWASGYQGVTSSKKAATLERL